MKKDKEIPILDFDELVDYIYSVTKYDKEIINRILDEETEFMRKVGIITECQPPFPNDLDK